MSVVDLDITTGKGFVIAVFLLLAIALFLVTGGLTLILGVAIVGGVLAVAYYVGVRLHLWASGKRGRRMD